MDDLTFRKAIYSDPYTKDREVLASIEEDQSRQAFMKELQVFEHKVQQALQVEVPDNLKERIILRQAIEEHRQQRRYFSRSHLAMAASVAFTIGIFTEFLFTNNSDVSEYALGHYYNEQAMIKGAYENISLEQANAKLAGIGGHFSELPNSLIFANYCDFNGQKSLHLVFTTNSGQVTLFMVPKNHELDFVTEFSDERLRGKTVPYGRGDIIILSEKQQKIDTFEHQVKKNLEWEI